jgi:hypothetical protein
MMKELKEAKQLQVNFVDHTDKKLDPVLLGKSLFSFSPVFNSGDQLSFKKVQEELSILQTYWGKQQLIR